MAGRPGVIIKKIKKLKRIKFSESWLDTKKDFRKNGLLYVMVLPVVIFYIIFCYVPMYGIIIAFKSFSMNVRDSFFTNIINSDWVGFKYFLEFIKSRWFLRVITNTFNISFATLIFGFPAPIILALLINELRLKFFKKTVQTVTYLPHFISLVVICGIIRDFTSDRGVVSVLLAGLTGGAPSAMLNNPGLFVPVYVISDIWQGVGWGSIIYLAALTGIDPQLYEAAAIDGARRWKQTLHITLPGIIPTVSIMLILRLGSILNVGYEKIILLYNPLTWNVGEVISTYTYKRGLVERNYSFSAAVGLFNSAVNLIFLVSANLISRKVNDVSLW
jgi:putative aldouronate transport system permease protein